ncbi:MAG TPA: phytoene/squalene synthase family protein [Gemmatimonadaceae bacterium]|nr:phytoene/squalene synthase family protein [Gemmatimonadaceae bacterium]
MSGVPRLSAVGAYMAHHSRSFRFATLTLGAETRGRIERVYAWCRHTDNIVDAPSMAAGTSIAAIEARLDEWLRQSGGAYDGAATGTPLLDAVMSDLRASGGPFDYPAALIRGVRSDLRFRQFETMGELRAYTHDVAAVVGLWLCALHGVRDPWMLERAAALGHAMQLTNILRDVGEDMRSGRVYLPADRMRAHGVTMLDLYEMRDGRRRVTLGYRGLMEELIASAEADYDRAREAIPRLPGEFGRAVAVASEIYAGIHDALRDNGYDNFRLRARTTMWRKTSLATRALWRLRQARRRSPGAVVPAGSQGGTGQRPVHQKLAAFEGEPLGAKVVALRYLDAPRTGDAVPRLQVARLRAGERRW